MALRVPLLPRRAISCLCTRSPRKLLATAIFMLPLRHGTALIPGCRNPAGPGPGPPPSQAFPHAHIPPILNPPIPLAGPAAAPQPGEPFRTHGNQLAAQGDYNGAVVMYNSALQLAPHDTELLLSRSLAHMVSTPARLDLALKDADDAITLNPGSAQAWMQKGEVLQSMGDSANAIDVFSNAVGCAQPNERLAAQRALAGARQQASAGANANANVNLNANQQLPQIIQPSSSPQPSTTASLYSSPVTSPPPPLITTTYSASGANTSSSGNRSATLSPTMSPSTTASLSPGLSPPLEQPRAATPSILGSAPSPPAPITASPPSNTTEDPSRRTSMLPASTANRNMETSRATAQTVNRNSTSTTSHVIPQSLFDDLSPPDGPPPAYTENLRDPVVLNRKLDELEQILKIKNKGSLLVQPYTLPGQIDAVRLLYNAMTANELTARETGSVDPVHPNLGNMVLNTYSYPGNTYIDADCETLAYYESKTPGTVRMAGYSEEYRLQQLRASPLLSLTLESSSVLPEIPLSKIVERLRKLQGSPQLEDNEGLCELIGLTQATAANHGFFTGGSRQKQIDYICMGLNKSKYDAAARFVDLNKVGCISSYFIGSLSSGDGLRNFLYQILLGCELLIRLRKEPVTTSYTGIMTDSTSALVVLGSMWMSYVTFNGPSNLQAKDSANSYTFISRVSKSQSEALIRFGEALGWPYMDEARNTIETAYSDLVARRIPWNADMWDWLFNLMLPGKIYRHKIMACLVYCSPTVRSLNAAPFYDNGLIVKDVSYWPKRTTLGRVLGGLRNVQSVAGWVGPVPAPSGDKTGWIRLTAREATMPVPVKSNTGQSALNDLGYDENGTMDRYTFLESLLNPNEWVTMTAPERPAGDNSGAELKSINLTQLPVDEATRAALPTLPPETYRASVEFNVNGTSVTYMLYTNPVFVAAQPCVGAHVIHKKEGERYLRNVIRVQNLKTANPSPNDLVVIDALGPNEDAVARAWCAERGRCAIVRRGNECCFTCTVCLAIGRKGLGFNVIILSRA
ncbi:uncharacterized protein BDV17DRAFT_254769 [Aspergillus undulatus]|uniref:uncharacterized protein n=1 Tax=Aspergillus undulatus TaxID=1810928 RepID=UPI003CCE2B77